MGTSWNPLYDKLIVRRHKPKEAHDEEGKIQVADAYQQKQNQGIVVKAGSGRLGGEPLTVQEGMEVLFGQHGGQDLDESEDLVMLREDELLAWRWPAEKE
jgi:co-chaperonin GroES (HSP10)